VLSLYDAHNHFHDDWLASNRAEIDRALCALGLRRAVVNGTCEQDWPVVASLGREYGWILPSYGLHPWDCGNRSPDWQKLLRAQLEANPGAAVGEIGLDRWILERARPDDPRLAGLGRAPLDEQIEVFSWQLELAATLSRAASIHCLEAFGAMLETLMRLRRPGRGFLLHAYGGPVELVRKFSDLGAYFSFNGSFLDDRHVAKQEVFRHIPADRLLVETDAPAMPLPQQWATHRLAPAPGGQTINHPANLEVAYAGLASLRGVPVEELALLVESNFLRLFGAQGPPG
jgi:TatD DNase family protein